MHAGAPPSDTQFDSTARAPSTTPPTVVVLGGGSDAERPISLLSAAAVAEGLRASRRWNVVAHTLEANDPAEVRAAIAPHAPAVVFPVLHGPWGEGGSLQRVLENAGVPYVGSRPFASDLAMDKQRTKDAAAAAGVAVIDGRVVHAPDLARPTVAEELVAALGEHVVLKPVDDGSSVDLFVTRGPEELRAAIESLRDRRRRMLVERFTPGRELTVGIVDGDALPVVEVRPAEGTYDFAAKYERTDTVYVIEPELPDGLAEQLASVALTTARVVGVRDLARVDFLLAPDGPRMLELNTMPGFTASSLLPRAADAAGMPMPVLCDRLAQAAHDRIAV